MTGLSADADGRSFIVPGCGVSELNDLPRIFFHFFFSFQPTPPHFASSSVPSSVAAVICGKSEFVAAVANKRVGGAT